jgi:calmodulin
MSRKVKDSDPEAELREAFAVFDQDKSGTISADELRRVLRSIGDDVSDADVDEMLRMADVNGDGSIDCKSCRCFLARPNRVWPFFFWGACVH